MRLFQPFLLLFLLSTLPATAQRDPEDPAFIFQRIQYHLQQRPTDSADFAQFGVALARCTQDSLAPKELSAYRLVWEVTCDGRPRLMRGHGTDLLTFLKDHPEQRFEVPVCCPRYFGGRYAVVHWEPPTGLARFHYWFFERQ